MSVGTTQVKSPRRNCVLAEDGVDATVTAPDAPVTTTKFAVEPIAPALVMLPCACDDAAAPTVLYETVLAALPLNVVPEASPDPPLLKVTEFVTLPAEPSMETPASDSEPEARFSGTDVVPRNTDDVKTESVNAIVFLVVDGVK